MHGSQMNHFVSADMFEALSELTSKSPPAARGTSSYEAARAEMNAVVWTLFHRAMTALCLIAGDHHQIKVEHFERLQKINEVLAMKGSSSSHAASAKKRSSGGQPAPVLPMGYFDPSKTLQGMTVSAADAASFAHAPPTSMIRPELAATFRLTGGAGRASVSFPMSDLLQEFRARSGSSCRVSEQVKPWLQNLLLWNVVTLVNKGIKGKQLTRAQISQAAERHHICWSRAQCDSVRKSA